MWRERLDGNAFLAETWLAHQRRDEYWRQGSVCEDYGAIEAAVYAVGGWSDGYTDAILRLLEGLTGPRKGLIGPWEHMWPGEGSRPAHRLPAGVAALVGSLAQGRRHRRHGRPHAARLDAGLREPRGSYAVHAAGALGDRGALALRRVVPDGVCISQPTALGKTAATGRCYATLESADARGRRRLLAAVRQPRRPARRPARRGRPIAVLRLAAAADRARAARQAAAAAPRIRRPPAAFVVVRLCDVHPDGTSALVTRGVLNLCHRHGHDRRSRSTRASASTSRCR